MRAERFEVADELECNGGTVLGVLSDVVAARVKKTLLGDDELRLRSHRLARDWQHVDEERVVRVILDAAVPTVEEYRVRRTAERFAEDTSLPAELQADSILYDLESRTGLLERIEANGLASLHFEMYGLTPTVHVTDIILGGAAPFQSGAPGYFAVGTIEPTDPVDMIYDWDTPLSALQELAKITGSELRVRRNGATNYLIDLLLQIGSGAPVPLLGEARNITSATVESDSEKLTTRAYPQGGGSKVDGDLAMIVENGFEVESISVNTATFTQDIVLEDGQFDGMGLHGRFPDASIVAVTGSTAPDQVTFASIGSLAVGDIVTFVRNASGHDLTYLESPSAITLFGGPSLEVSSEVVKRPDIPNVNNLIPNAFFTRWTDGGRGAGFFLPPAPRPLLGIAPAPNPPQIPSTGPPILLPPSGGCFDGICLVSDGSGGLGGDDFNRTNHKNLGVGWHDNEEDWRIQTNEAELVTTGWASFWSVPQRNELVIRADVVAGTGEVYIGKWVHLSLFRDQVTCGINLTGATDQKLAIYVYVNGRIVASASSDITPDDTLGQHVLKCWIRNGQIDVWYDETLNTTLATTAFDNKVGWSAIYGILKGVAAGTVDNLQVATTNVITCSNLGAGEKMDIDGTVTVESGGTATWDTGGKDFPLDTITILDAGNNPIAGPWTLGGGNGIYPGMNFFKQ